MKRENIFFYVIIFLITGCSAKISSDLNNRLNTAEKASYPRKNFEPGSHSFFQQAAFITLQNLSLKETGQLKSDAEKEETTYEKGGSPASLLSASGKRKTAEWGTESYSSEKLLSKALYIQKFAKRNGYNSSIVLLIDMQIKSGKKRFFVYDIDNKKILRSGLVAHGSSGKSFSPAKAFSNTPGSSCTSLGIYKVGSAYQGSFGLAYKLHGLEESNSNAFKRYVVLHSMGCIPDNEIEGALCQSEGCPSVSPLFLEYLESILSKPQKPVLMWIFR